MGSSSPDRAENTKIFENHHPEKNIPTFLLLPGLLWYKFLQGLAYRNHQDFPNLQVKPGEVGRFDQVVFFFALDFLWKDQD